MNRRDHLLKLARVGRFLKLDLTQYIVIVFVIGFSIWNIVIVDKLERLNHMEQTARELQAKFERQIFETAHLTAYEAQLDKFKTAAWMFAIKKLPSEFDAAHVAHDLFVSALPDDSKLLSLVYEGRTEYESYLEHNIKIDLQTDFSGFVELYNRLLTSHTVTRISDIHLRQARSGKPVLRAAITLKHSTYPDA